MGDPPMTEIPCCRYCGSSRMTLDVASGCRMTCTRCHRTVSAQNLRKAAGLWAEDPKEVPWPMAECRRCKVSPVLGTERIPSGKGYCFICPKCKASSKIGDTPFEAMLAWRDEMSSGGEDRCLTSWNSPTGPTRWPNAT